MTLFEKKTGTDKMRWVVFVIVSLFFLYEFIARVEPSLASVEIAKHFHLSEGEFGVLSSVFFWIYAPMQILVGLLLDRFGVRRFVVPSIFLCALGIALFSLTVDPFIAGIGRFLTGLGASFAFVSALYVVNHQFSPNQFAMLSGVVNAIGMLGTAMGAVALTSMIEIFNWQTLFLVTSGAGSLLFLLAFVFLKDNPIKKTEISTHFLQPLFITIQNKRVWLIAILGALYYMPVNVFGGLWGHEDLVRGHGLSSVQAETAVSMIFIGLATGGILVGVLSDWLGHRKWLVVSNVFLCAMAYGVVVLTEIHSVWLLSIALFLGGFFGGAQMLTFAMAKEGHSKAISGTVIAFVNMVGIGGALIFQPLVGILIDQSNGNFIFALASMPACLIAATILALFVQETRHPDHIL